MKNLDALREILGFIYDGFGSSEDYGVAYFSRYKSELKKYEPKEVISLQIKTYSHDYVLEFLMGAPYVWEEFSSRDWIDLMRHLSPRPDPSRNIEPMAAYCDIVFLNRYLGIDAFSFFMNDNKVPALDKCHVESYFLIYKDLLEINELDAEDMDGIYLIGYETLTRARDEVLKEGIFAWNNPVSKTDLH
ncbi:hypothetical protein FOC84_14910 [Achromobacter pestifer]|uniref:Uncharacterized protein n=1 Tax=Achromobacter pestifer TaxID=1353889 RepID=A0A7D4E0U1_9BURK|nr:hypothetical protein [Achromobacter pestifer]QKH36169.1 hypothetical protein FOC84_14910 [Achromobacter pestifer]